MDYIEELKAKVVSKFGKNVVSKPIAQELRDAIFDYQKEYLSESTIRRFFYLIPSGKSSIVTVDILSRYIGLRSYCEFCEFCEKIVQFTAKTNTDELILNGFQSKIYLTILEVQLISHRIIQCLKEQDLDLLHRYLDNEHLFGLLTLNPSIHDMFAQTLGPYIEDDHYIRDVQKILLTRYFIPLILYKYVDVGNSGLEKYYNWIIVNYNSKYDLLFAASILSLNKIYSNNIEEAKILFDLIDINEYISSPVLSGRIALLCWYFSDDFDELIRKAELFKDNLMLFSIDILCLLLNFDKIVEIKKWFKHFPDINWDQKSWVEKEIDYFITLVRYVSNEDFEGLRICFDKKIYLINSITTFNKTYKIIEERYIKK